MLQDLSRSSEILIGWVHATLIVVFGAFTVLRLILAYRNGLSTAVKIKSLLLDVLMLRVTIWRFHIEYGQPPAFYLKAPTQRYVFISMLREYQHIAVPIIHRNHGSVVTCLGDGIMVTFGATTASISYCADALR